MVLGLMAADARGQGTVRVRGADPAAAAEATAGKRDDARAAWWGFDPVESTRALQSAIDSGARRVVVEDMGAPWVVDQIRLRGNQEVVFEPGVVVQAKRGAFKGGSDSLFRADSVKDLTLRGPGATLRMWRDDYDDPARYEKAEWRHVLDLRSCADVRVLGLTLAESGGDGIYLGVGRSGAPNTNVLVQDVVCDRNYRQGISVISVRGLTIERCVLKNTAGTPPMAGIDFEPNSPSEEVADCLMRDCLAENNAGDGYLFALQNSDDTTRPVSVTLERCRSVGNHSGLRLHAAGRPEGGPVRGRIVARDCQFVRGKWAGLVVGTTPHGGCAVRFERCRVVDAAADRPEQAPIVLLNPATDPEEAGGVAFVDCEVVDPVDRRPLDYHDASGGGRLIEVTGSLIVEHAGRRETVTLDQARIDSWFPAQVVRAFPPHPGREGPFRPIAPAATGQEWSCHARLRVRAEWLVWAEAGDEVALTFRFQPVGKSGIPSVPIFRTGPSGVKTTLGTARETLEASFRAEETGAHRIVCDPGGATASISRSNRRVAMTASGRGRIHLLGGVRELYFAVPDDVKAFGVRITGGEPGERVKAALLDPSGTVVDQQDDIDGRQFVVERGRARGVEVWGLRLGPPSKGVMEDHFVQLQGTPPVLAESREALFEPAR